MAKSEIPSIVVHSGASSNGVGGGSSPPESSRRLVKQEEVDIEEESLPICGGMLPSDAGRGSSQRLRLLVRSQAVHDDTSPPLDPEGGPRMLSVQGQADGGRKQGTGGSSPQGSLEGSSPSLSRDSSTETYTDSTGIDLEQFIIETLHKNHKDRVMMLKIEQDLINLIKDAKRPSHKFQQMSSYHRMLVHRVAAYFGLDHNVDQSGTSVIVNKTRNTRLPDVRFKDEIREDLLQEEPKKSILKRDSASFEDGKESPERQSSTDSHRSKSIEQREEEYEKARARIFNQDDGVGGSPLSRSSQEDLRWSNELRPWSSTDSDSSGRRGPLLTGLDIEGCAKGKMYSLLTKEAAEGPRLAAITKASSFGGVSVLHRDSSLNEARTAAFRTAKSESFNVSSLPTVVQGPQDQATPISTTAQSTPATCAPPSTAADRQQAPRQAPSESGASSVQHYSVGGAPTWPPIVDPSQPVNPQTETVRPVRVAPLTGHPSALMLNPLHPGGYMATPPRTVVYVPFLPHNEGMVREPDMDCGMADVGLSSSPLVPSSEPPQPHHPPPGAVELGGGGYLVHPIRGLVAPHQVPTSMQGPVYYVQQAVPTSCATTLRPSEMPPFLQPSVPGPVAGPMLASGYRVQGYHPGGNQGGDMYVTYAVAEPQTLYPGGVLVGNPAGGAAQVVPMYLAMQHGTPAQPPGAILHPQNIGGPGSTTPPSQFSLRYLPVRPQTPPGGGASPPGYTLYSAGPAGAQGCSMNAPPQPAAPPVFTAFQMPWGIQPPQASQTFGKPAEMFPAVCATRQPRYTTCQTLSNRRHVGHYTAAELYQAVMPATEQSGNPHVAPALSTVYRSLPDVRLLGHPLQQQLRQFVPPPTRFPLVGAPSLPPPSQCLGGRPPKTGGRKQRNTRAANRVQCNASGDAPFQHATTTSQPANNMGAPSWNILEVEGLPESLKPQEVERFLEPFVSTTGAHLHFRGVQVLAVFDSASAAQGALLAGPNIPNVRLRPLSLLPHHPPS